MLFGYFYLLLFIGGEVLINYIKKMSRSKWKGPYVSSLIWQQLNLKNKKFNTFSRNSCIVPQLINLNIKVHNGKSFINLLITKNMIGHKLGEFVPTRKKFSFKKKKN